MSPAPEGSDRWIDPSWHDAQPAAAAPPNRHEGLAWGCLIVGVIVLVPFVQMFAYLVEEISNPPLDPPPAEVIPSFPASIVVRCEKTEEGTGGVARNSMAAQDARRVLLVRSPSLSREAAVDAIASAFRREGWSLDGGPYERETYGSKEPYRLFIGPPYDVDRDDQRCEPGVSAREPGLIAVAVSDSPYDR